MSGELPKKEVGSGDTASTPAPSVPSNQTGSITGPKSHWWNPADPTDGKKQWECKSCYPLWIRFQIFVEAAYLAFLLIAGFYLLVWLYSGTIPLYTTHLQFDELNDQIRKLATFPIAGLIGGAMYGLKYLYRVAARGWWHEDRRIWRIFSPLLAASLATMVGILIDGGLLGLSYNQGGANSQHSTLLGVAFVTGYFADSAMAKLQDVANVIFASSIDKK